MKREGCDFLICSMCKTELCWATKGKFNSHFRIYTETKLVFVNCSNFR